MDLRYFINNKVIIIEIRRKYGRTQNLIHTARTD